jgi:hypothetical protein
MNRHRGDDSYTFVPMSIEKNGRLGAQLMGDLINRLGCEAAECIDFAFSSAQFVSGISCCIMHMWSCMLGLADQASGLA